MELFNTIFSFAFGYKEGCWSINPVPSENPVTIASHDYYLGYLSHNEKGNKGGNSYVFALYNAQEEFNEESEPINVIKISKRPAKSKQRSWVPGSKNRRFVSEVEALTECKVKHHQNVIRIEEISGYCDYGGKMYPFYIMEYADMDLKSFIESKCLSIEEKVGLCLQIALGLKELYALNYYHRDLKPENMFIVDGTWKIGDLGLIATRDQDAVEDCKSIIGPRGWLSPEAMNKYLTEGKGLLYHYDCSIDHQSDIFQLGKVFWYIMQGNVPIGGIKSSDFKEHNSDMYVLLKTMLNHSKKRRYKHIDDVIEILIRINRKFY